MTVQGLTFRGVSRVAQIPPCALTVDDLRKLFVDLNERALEAAERQFSTIQRPPETPLDKFDQDRREAVAASGLTMIVLGNRGEQVVLTAPQGIEPSILPDVISTITFDSALSFKTRMNYQPLDRFQLRLDFSEPPGFGKYNPWDQPTPNSSVLEIIGTNDTWVAGVHQKVNDFLGHRKRHRRWLHSALLFSAANWFVGLPAAFWVVYRVDAELGRHLASWPAVLRSAGYIYVFLVSFLTFRVFIGALRWLFPLVELQGARGVRARAGVGALAFAIAAAFLYDVLKVVTGWIRNG